MVESKVYLSMYAYLWPKVHMQHMKGRLFAACRSHPKKYIFNLFSSMKSKQNNLHMAHKYPKIEIEFEDRSKPTRNNKIKTLKITATSFLCFFKYALEYSCAWSSLG